MPKKCDCPGVDVYDHGYGKRVQVWKDTEKEAEDALKLLLPAAKAAALAAQNAALVRAKRVGRAACKVGKGDCKGKVCRVQFVDLPLGGPWTAVGSVAPYTKWLARGGYEWTIVVFCSC